MSEVQDGQLDWWSHIPGSVKSTVIGCLLLAVSGNLGVISTLKQTDDRFRGADFQREIAIRDAAIAECQQYRRDHTKESAKYIEQIEAMRRLINNVPPEEVNGAIRELERRVHNLELELARQ